MRDRPVMKSSTIPSTKYSCSGSPLMFWNGSTAIDGRSENGVGRVGRGPHVQLGALGDAVDAHRAGDVLNDVLALVEEADRQFFADLLANRGANTNLTRYGECLKTRRDVDAVAKDVALLDDHVTEINADAIANAVRFGQVRVAVFHSLLHDDGAAHRIDDAGEFN